MDPSAAASTPACPTRYVVDDLILDVGQRRAWRDGETLPLSKRSFDLLVQLARRAPDAVSHADLTDAVWGPRRVVTPEALSQSILRLRHAIDDSAAAPRYVESVRGHGYRLIPVVRVANDGGPGAESQAGTSTSWLALAAVAMLAVIVARAWLGPAELAQPATAGSLPPLSTAARLPNSLAVLPFHVTHPGPGDEELAAAVHAGLLNRIGQAEALNVIARGSVMTYATDGLSAPEVADLLGVRTLLHGSVHRVGAHPQVLAELIDGRDGTLLWSRDYAIDRGNPLGVQEAMAADLAGVLAEEFSLPYPIDFGDPPTVSAEAWAFYLRALEDLGESRRANDASGQAYLDQAIRLDPAFSHAYGLKALFHAYWLGLYEGPAEQASAALATRTRLVHENVERALSLNPDTDVAHWAHGIAQMYSWHWGAAQTSFEEALALSPNNATFLAQYDWFRICVLGERQGTAGIERALELDPRNPFAHEAQGRIMACLGDRPAAYAAFEHAVALEPISLRRRFFRAMLAPGVLDDDAALAALRDLEASLGEGSAGAIISLGGAYAALGRHGDAARHFKRFRRLSERAHLPAGTRAFGYLALGEHELALAALEQAADNLGPGLGFLPLLNIKWNGAALPVLEQPRFVALRKRLTSLDPPAG